MTESSPDATSQESLPGNHGADSSAPRPRKRRSWFRRLVRVLGILFLLFVVLVGALFYRPAFYRRGMAIDSDSLFTGSAAFIKQTSALIEKAPKKEGWETAFKEQDMNGWLSTDAVGLLGGPLSHAASDPRIAIESDRLAVGCKVGLGKLTVVPSAEFDVYVPEPHIVALRVRRARIGAIPFPLSPLLGEISRQAESMGLLLHWEQSAGDPVAIVRLPPIRAKAKAELTLEAVELKDSLIIVRGSTESLNDDDEKVDAP
jgi:hypothetical protein